MQIFTFQKFAKRLVKKYALLQTELEPYAIRMQSELGGKKYTETHPKEETQCFYKIMADKQLTKGDALYLKGSEEFEKYYDIYLKTEDMQGLVGEYDQKLANMNKQVRVLDPKDPYEGTARGITPKGELIVDTWEARKLVSSGEVSVRGLYGYV